MIIISSLHRDYLPSSWFNFVATLWDNAMLFGSIGVFITLFALFVRFLPMISMYEVRELAAFLKARRRQREMSGTGLLRRSSRSSKIREHW